MVRILRQQRLCWLLIFSLAIGLAVSGCSRGKGSSVRGLGASSTDELAAEIKKAFAGSDASRLARLFFEGPNSKLMLPRQQSAQALIDSHANLTVLDVKFLPPKDPTTYRPGPTPSGTPPEYYRSPTDPYQFILRGVTYRPSMPPTGQVQIVFDIDNADRIFELPYGKDGDVYFLISPEPVGQ